MERITAREKGVFRLIARGLSCRGIANRLGITEYTVRKHRANLCRKLGCHSAAQLSARAIRMHATATSGASTSLAHDMAVQLLPRERQVIQLLARGMTSKQIARKLGDISPRTVQKHRERAMRKLRVHGMNALMWVATLSGDDENDEW